MSSIFKSKKGLGRGLSALFGDVSPKEAFDEKKEPNTVPISDLSRNPYQPRQTFNEFKLKELAESIKIPVLKCASNEDYKKEYLNFYSTHILTT